MQTVSMMRSGNLGRELDLERLVDEIKSVVGRVDANFTSDSIVTLQMERDGPAYTVYRTGTFQIRGSKSKEELKTAEDAFLDLLDEINVDVAKYEFESVSSSVSHTLTSLLSPLVDSKRILVCTQACVLCLLVGKNGGGTRRARRRDRGVGGGSVTIYVINRYSTLQDTLTTE